jgi:hypothetical protein
MRATQVLVLICAVIAGAGGGTTQARVVAGTGAAQTPAAVYASALQAVQSVRRLQFVEVAHVYVQHPTVVQVGFRYLAPDRVATVAQSKQPSGKILTIEQIQVGTIVCQEPPAWACYHHPRQDIAARVRSYIQPRVQGLRFSSESRTFGSGSGRYHATVIHLSAERQAISYSGMLTVNDASHLPVSLTSRATMDGKVAESQQVSFTYGGTFSVNLPKGKNVRLPRP